MSDIVERLRDHATDWNGAQMPDIEPAKGDPTAGTLREAAAEITRLRADLAAAQADAKSWKTVALANQAASQSHQERWAKAEEELASGSFYKEADIDRLMAERDAAQEREQSRALPVDDAEMVERVLGDWGFVEALIEHATHAHVDEDLELRRAVARAALSAVRGKP